MLAKRVTSVEELFTKFGEKNFTCEFKYDGERAQIHYQIDDNTKPTIKIFSRNLENNTNKYPEILNKIEKLIKEGNY